MSENSEQSGLSHDGRFAAHVWTSDEKSCDARFEPTRGALLLARYEAQLDVVWGDVVAGVALHHTRVEAILNLQEGLKRQA